MMRRFLLTIMFSVAVLSVAVEAAAFVQNPGRTPAGADEDVLAVSFVDPSGARQETPYFDVDGAFPGMPAETRTVSVRNDGTVPVAYDLNVLVTPAPGGVSIADVLVVTVTGNTGDLLYRGPLAHMQVDGRTPIAPGVSAAHTIVIEWPDRGAEDNRYQGVQTVFDLKARARSAG